MIEILGEQYPKRQNLLNQEIRQKLPQLYSTEEAGLDAQALVKFFTPDSNWTWYASEFDGDDRFFGLVIGHEIELGYFSLKELETTQGPLGLPIERDLYYKPQKLQELMDSHKRERDGRGRSLDENEFKLLIDKLGHFAEIIGLWDERVTEVVGIGNLTEKTVSSEDDIQLVCTFDPGPLDDSQAFFAVANILVRNDHERVAEKLGIKHSIDLAFKVGDVITLPNGKRITQPSDQIKIWSKSDERKQSR